VIISGFIEGYGGYYLLIRLFVVLLICSGLIC
jgi:hypothetical protein